MKTKLKSSKQLNAVKISLPQMNAIKGGIEKIEIATEKIEVVM